MAVAKIEVKVGEISFSGEGEQDWLEKQFDKLLTKSEKLTEMSTRVSSRDEKEHSEKRVIEHSDTNLVTFLNKNKVNTATDRLLGTAIWLQEIKKCDTIKLGDVTKALRDAKQNKLSNANQFLAENIKKGFCEGNADVFFVTEKGVSRIIKSKD